MRKLFLIMVLSLLIIISSCSFKSRNDLVKEIIDCFDSKDVDRLKDMICTENQKKNNIKEEIGVAYDFLGGRITNYSFSRGSEEKSSRDGKIVFSEYSMIIDNITIENQGEIEYLISYGYREVCNENENSEGLMGMKIYKKSSEAIEEWECVKIGEYID